MERLSDLYQELILDHNKNPKNYKLLTNPTHTSEGYNPLCGDHYTLELVIENEKIVDIGFTGKGCAISKSSASIMTTCMKGLTIAQAQDLTEKFTRMLKEENTTIRFTDSYAKLEALRGVKAFPTRIKCANLMWHALRSAFLGKHEATTE